MNLKIIFTEKDVKERLKHPSGICGFFIDLKRSNIKENLKFENIDLKIKKLKLFY